MKIVPFDTVGLFIGLHPISLCGASAAVRPWRKNKVPIPMAVDIVLHCIQLKVTCFSKNSVLVHEG